MSLTTDDSVSTHQIASAAAPAPSPDGASLPLYQSLATPSSFSLTEFFSRPVCLYTYSGAGTITTLPTETYASDYVALQSVQEKVKYLKLLRGTFKIDFLLTTSPYAFGQFICAFYMGSPASTGAATLDVTTFNYWLSSKDKVILDCANMTSGSITVPMHIVYPYTDVAAALPDSVLTEMRMSVTTLTPILNAMDGTSSPFTIKVFVSLLNPEVTVPVYQDSSFIYTSETQRAMEGPISFPASIVARIGKSLSQVPVIGKFAYATSLAAEAVSSIAILFGFSRPKDMSIIAYPHMEDFASYAGNLRVKGLTLDPLAEIPIDNSFLGDMGDNLTYQNTIQREGLLAQFSWNKTQVATTLLYQASVSPSLSTSITGGVMSLPPVSYVAQLFNLWRGTLIFRIVVPANRYLRGKLRFYWSPTYIAASPSAVVYQQITQNATSVLLDLAQSTEIILEFPYAARSPFGPIISAWADQESGTSANPGNGYLYCIVEEPLLCQSTALGLTVLVWLSAGEDFHFAIPSVNRMPYLHRQAFNPTFSSVQTSIYQGPLAGLPDPPAVQQTVADSTDQLYYLYTSRVESNELNPAISKKVIMIPPILQSDVMPLHIGEEFVSLRNMLKRFYPNYFITNGGNPTTFGAFITYLPLEPFLHVVGSTVYSPCGMNTPLRYISNLFYGVRGSVRYRLNHPLDSSTGANTPATVSVFRSFYPPLTQLLGNAITTFNWMWLKASAGSGEATFLIQNGEPIFFEIPYQCNSQYQRTTVILPPYAGTPQYGVMVNYQSYVNTQIEVYVAAGEDFMPVIWNGVPLLCAFPPGAPPS
jgi:hypothetical protein